MRLGVKLGGVAGGEAGVLMVKVVKNHVKIDRLD